MYSLQRFKNLHRGETGLIIGNGPSLDKTPLEKFNLPSFGSNMIFRKPFMPTYYCIVDEDMMKACLHMMPSSFRPTMFIRAEAGIGEPIYPIVVNGFSTDIANFIVMGGTVTYAMMQIAFYMGFRTLLLVGVDHNYPKSGELNGRFRAEGNDPDHFQTHDHHPYFISGHEFNAPELEGTAKNYAIAEELFRKDGRRILNLTPGTKLNVFEKDKIENWI